MFYSCRKLLKLFTLATLYFFCFKDCLLVHIATLVLLQKNQDLFILGHRLVDTQPDDEISWYTVGCYYYSIRNYAMAKNFLSQYIALVTLAKMLLILKIIF